MIKEISVICLCLLLPALITANEATHRESILLGGELTLSHSRVDIISISDDDVLEWGFCPKLQILVSNHFAVGLTGAVARMDQNGIYFNKYGVGPVVSFYGAPEKGYGPYMETYYTYNYLGTTASVDYGIYYTGDGITYLHFPILADDHYRSEFGLNFGYMMRLSNSFSLTLSTTLGYIAGSGLPSASSGNSYEDLVYQDDIAIYEKPLRNYTGAGFAIRIGILSFL